MGGNTQKQNKWENEHSKKVYKIKKIKTEKIRKNTRKINTEMRERKKKTIYYEHKKRKMTDLVGFLNKNVLIDTLLKKAQDPTFLKK